MNRTGIEYLDFTWNPVTGCSNGCSYCWARQWAYRLAGRYGYPQVDPFTPTFHKDRLHEPTRRRKPAIIGVCFMGELFDRHITSDQRRAVLQVIQECPQHIFLILTKQMGRAGLYDFPKNVWLGMSVDGITNTTVTLPNLLGTNASVKFISFEPLLEYESVDLQGIDWAIIGAQTNPTIQNHQATYKLLKDLHAKDLPVFMKNNMAWHEIIQQYPKLEAQQRRETGDV